MAEEYLKKKHKGGDQDASLLEGAVKTFELRNGKPSFKRSRSDRPAASGRDRGGRGQYGMSRFNWSQAAMQIACSDAYECDALRLCAAIFWVTRSAFTCSGCESSEPQCRHLV